MNGLPPSTSVPSIPLVRGPAAFGQWSVGGAALFVAFIYGMALLVATGLQQGYVAWRLGPDAALDWSALQGLPRDEQSLIFIGAQLGTQLVQIALILALVARLHANPRAALGLAPVRLSLGGWIGALALVFGVKLAAALVASGLGPTNARDDLGVFAGVVRTPLAWWLFLATVVLAGVTEELLFRGVLSRTLEGTRLGFWLGAALASGAFAILHTQYGVSGQLIVFAIGMALAWIRHSSGSLWPAIVCHAANNAVALLAMRAIG